MIGPIGWEEFDDRQTDDRQTDDKQTDDRQTDRQIDNNCERRVFIFAFMVP